MNCGYQERVYTQERALQLPVSNEFQRLFVFERGNKNIYIPILDGEQVPMDCTAELVKFMALYQQYYDKSDPDSNKSTNVELTSQTRLCDTLNNFEIISLSQLPKGGTLCDFGRILCNSQRVTKQHYYDKSVLFLVPNIQLNMNPRHQSKSQPQTNKKVLLIQFIILKNQNVPKHDLFDVKVLNIQLNNNECLNENELKKQLLALEIGFFDTKFAKTNKFMRDFEVTLIHADKNRHVWIGHKIMMSGNANNIHESKQESDSGVSETLFCIWESKKRSQNRKINSDRKHAENEQKMNEYERKYAEELLDAMSLKNLNVSKSIKYVESQKLNINTKLNPSYMRDHLAAAYSRFNINTVERHKSRLKVCDVLISTFEHSKKLEDELKKRVENTTSSINTVFGEIRKRLKKRVRSDKSSKMDTLEQCLQMYQEPTYVLGIDFVLDCPNCKETAKYVTSSNFTCS